LVEEEIKRFSRLIVQTIAYISPPSWIKEDVRQELWLFVLKNKLQYCGFDDKGIISRLTNVGRAYIHKERWRGVTHVPRGLAVPKVRREPAEHNSVFY
jgi:hypothetical protein